MQVLDAVIRIIWYWHKDSKVYQISRCVLGDSRKSVKYVNRASCIAKDSEPHACKKLVLARAMSLSRAIEVQLPFILVCF